MYNGYAAPVGTIFWFMHANHAIVCPVFQVQEEQKKANKNGMHARFLLISIANRRLDKNLSNSFRFSFIYAKAKLINFVFFFYVFFYNVFLHIVEDYREGSICSYIFIIWQMKIISFIETRKENCNGILRKRSFACIQAFLCPVIFIYLYLSVHFQ